MMMLSNVKFPVFVLREFDELKEVDGVITITSYTGEYIVDNKNLEGDTLGKRRLRITGRLYPLSKVAFTFKQLLKYSKKYKYFIDTNGKVFKYTKSVWTQLEYLPICGYRVTEKGYYIKPCNHVTEYLVEALNGMSYIGLLKLPRGGYIPYDLSDSYKKPSRRKI